MGNVYLMSVTCEYGPRPFPGTSADIRRHRHHVASGDAHAIPSGPLRRDVADEGVITALWHHTLRPARAASRQRRVLLADALLLMLYC